MSGAAHPQSPVRQQIVRDDRRARMIALACVGTVAALLVALVLALASDDSTPSGSDAAVPRLAIPPAAAYAHPGTRYDGGPEEGTRGASVPDAGAYASPGTRYDGGPEEGTRGQ